MLVQQSLGFDLGELPILQNLGDVRNQGIEMTLQGRVLQSNTVTWDATLNVSGNRNKLLRLAPGMTAQPYAALQRNVVGYPLGGFWARPASYSDANHDGIIEPSEVTVGDSVKYVGPATPKYETSLQSSLGLFRGVVTIGSLFDYRAGVSGYYGVTPTGAYYGTLRAQNDSTAPLRDQALAVARLEKFSNTTLEFTDAAFVRWRELSVTCALPARWVRRIGAASASVTASVQNLALWSRYGGVDPEVGSVGGGGSVDAFYSAHNADPPSSDGRGDGGGAIPLSRSWYFRLNLGI
jgi:hypothetical protein